MTNVNAKDIGYGGPGAGFTIDNGVDVTFGDGIVGPADPLVVDAANGDFHLRSANGHWTPTGYVDDDATSPAHAAHTS